MGNDDFHKKRKVRNTVKRKIEQKAILIALEDTKSSRFYFESLLKHKGFTGEVVFANHIGTNPKKVLEALEKHKNDHKKTNYKKEWVVIDKDDWSKDEFNGVIETARQKGICVAFSNESYELWILLHFERVTSYVSRVDLNSKLNKYFQERFGVEYSKASQDIYAFIVGLQNEAIKNAEHLIERCIRDEGKIQPYEKNPLTMVHELVKCLNNFYDNNEECDCFPLETIV